MRVKAARSLKTPTERVSVLCARSFPQGLWFHGNRVDVDVDGSDQMLRCDQYAVLDCTGLDIPLLGGDNSLISLVA